MSLLDCIKRIPSCLQNVADSYAERAKTLNDYLGNNKINEVVIIASGSSMNATKVTKYFAENRCELNVKCFYPNEFLNYTNYVNHNALYIVVSQGGSTKLVYECLNKVKENNLLHCTITEKIDSPIAKASDCAFEMGSVNEEYMYRTIGYSTTVVSTVLVELALAEINGVIEKPELVIADLEAAINNLDTVREITEKWYTNNKFSLMKRNQTIFAGAECLYETANEADIKVMEMVPMLTRSFELEEFIHGPQNAFCDNMIFFIFSDKRKDAEKARHIAEFLKNEIGFCALIGDQKIDDRDLNFEFKSVDFTMLEAITTIQVIAFHLAEDHGRDLKRGVNVSINNYIKKTL